MSITSFYTDVLGSNLRNTRWSWGSVDPIADRVYLRVWEHEIRSVGGTQAILVLRAVPRATSPGYRERQAHIGLLQAGAAGFGVLCTAAEPSAPGARTIKSFEDEYVLRFGRILKDGEDVYAEVLDRVPIEELARPRSSATTLANDLSEILRARVEFTERDALVSARIGQGRFRAQVLQLWDHRCAVTGAVTLDAIRASHIKPWRSSSDDERLDPQNGLPLVATLDALFDSGLICFDPAGALVASRRLPAAERSVLRLDGAKLTRYPTEKTQKYLAFHHSNVFRG